MIRQAEGALAIVLLRNRSGRGHWATASNFSSREWEGVMLDLGVTHWFNKCYEATPFAAN
jgi:hypothetical protein